MTTVQTNGSVSSSVLDAMNAGAASAAAKSDAEKAQDRFMTLLVTQMKNQDPLSPMDNAQMTSQLAQLSTVTGIDKLNTTMQSLMGSYQASQSVQAAGMIGHGVLVPGSSVALADKQAIFGVDLPGPADSLKVNIKDSTGKVVHSFDLGAQEAGTLPLTWDGKTDDGGAAADGNYTFDVVAKLADKTTPVTALSFGQVASVSTNSQGVKLNIPGVGAVNLSDVKQIL